MSKFSKLSRAEMKNILGGLVQPGNCDDECKSDSDCKGNNSSSTKTCIQVNCMGGQGTYGMCSSESPS